MGEWFKEWFSDDDYLRVYNHRDNDDAKSLIDTVINAIDLRQGAFILDAACGAGRHSVLLTQLGYNVVGFDLSKKLLSIAESTKKKLGLNVHFINSDLREVRFKKKFDLIFNVFTSFGYFETDDENFAFIKNSYEFLNPGAYYVLDFFNSDFIVKHLVAETERIVNGIKISEKRSIENDRVVKNIFIEMNGESKKYFESVKLYDKKTIISGFEEIGFNVLKIFGDYRGIEFDEKISERLIIIFQK